MILGGFGKFWVVLGDFGWVWVVLGRFGGRDDGKDATKNGKENALQIYY